MSKVTVTDIINLRESFVLDVNNQMSKIDDIIQEYNNADSLAYLEDIKKRLNAELQYFATMYAKIKAYKGTNHVYLENEMRELKSAATALIMDKKNVNVTTAERILHSYPYYKERKDVITKVMSFMIKVEEMYKRYEYTLQCVIQSISIAGKDFSNNQSND